MIVTHRESMKGVGAMVRAWVYYSGPRLQPALMWFSSPTAQINWSIQLSAESLSQPDTDSFKTLRRDCTRSFIYSFSAPCLTISSMSHSLTLSVLRGSWGFVTHLSGAINSSACAVLIWTSDSSLSEPHPYMFCESTILWSCWKMLSWTHVSSESTKQPYFMHPKHWGPVVHY